MDQLSYLVSGGDFSVSRDAEARRVPNPLTGGHESVRVKTSEETRWTRFHTLHVTYADGAESGARHRGVIVVAPSADTRVAVELTCRLSALVEDALMRDREEKRKAALKLPLEDKDPLVAHRAALGVTGGGKSLTSILFDAAKETVIKNCCGYCYGKASDSMGLN